MIWTASSDIKFYSWPANPEVFISYVPQDASQIINLSLSNDDRYILCITENGKCELLFFKDAAEVRLIHSFKSMEDISCAAFQKTTKRTIAIGNRQSQLALFDTKSKSISKLFQGIPSPLCFIEFNCNDQLLGAVCTNGTILIYDNSSGVDSGKLQQTFSVPGTSLPTDFKFHPTEPNVFAVSTNEGTVMVWDTYNGKKIYSAQTHSATVAGVTWVTNSDLIVTVGRDNKICLHDLNIKECIFRSNLQKPLSSVDVSPCGNYLATGTENGLMYIFDMRNLHQYVSMIRVHSGPVTKIRFDNQISCAPILDQPQEEINQPTTTQPTQEKKDFNLCKTKHSLSKILKENLYPMEGFPARSMPKTVTVDETFNISTFKDNILGSVQKQINNVRNQMLCHMNHLQNFIHTEFHKMEEQMDENWELFNIASYVAKTNIEDNSFDQARSTTDVTFNSDERT